MKISVVTPCFNAEKTLEDAYRTFALQDGVELEILFADDGSTDGTAEKIRAIAAQDNRVVPLIAEANAGVSNARNRALDVATGDFVFFLDADDKLMPDCLATLAGCVDYDTIDFVRGKHVLWWPTPDITQPNPDEERNFVEVQAVAPKSYPQIVAVYSSWNALYRRSLIETNKLRFNEAMRLGEDRDFNLRFFEVARRITLLNAYTYLWRKDERDAQQATTLLVADSVQAFENTLNFSQLARRPWFAQNPRHAIYLRSAMLVEMINHLSGFLDQLRKGTFNPAAKAAISATFSAIPADSVDIHIPGIKGWTAEFLPMYEFAARHLGSPLKDETFNEFQSYLEGARRRPARWIGTDSRAPRALEIVREAFHAAAVRRGTEGQQHEIKVLSTWGLFDRAFYRTANPDVADAGMDEVEHFVFHGAAELRNPNGWFNTGKYLQEHPELLVTGVNPLVHYAMTMQLAFVRRH